MVPSDTQSFVGKSIASRASRNQRTGLGSLKQLPHSGNAKRVASISNEQVIEMFEIFLAVFIGWVAITLAGHATWVSVAKLFGKSKGHPEADSINPVKRNAIAKSVIHELRVKGRIDTSTMNQLFSAINEQGSGTHLTSGIHPTASVNAVDSETQTPPNTNGDSSNSQQRNQVLGIEPDGPEILVAKLIDETVPASPDKQVPEPSAFTSSEAVDETQGPERISKQQLKLTTKNQQSPNTSVAITKTASPKARPTLSTGEIIQSFLSAHNIRWGELIAGTLIVVCSIGLVISLWGPLVQTHRAIPTLIFLAANAAIYGVGLYTLSRWRLRHTSRAVLVIATLLIPLSVLAGIAASGIDATQAIDLSDPITLVTIGLAGLVYSVFLYLGGKALTNRTHVWSIFTSVAGSIAALVFAPAAIRTFENQAGWLIAIASSAVVLACAMIGKWNRLTTATTTIGPAGARIRLLVMGLCVYSLAIATLSMGYHLREFDRQTWLPIAMASIPACIALAGVATSLRERCRNSTISMIGAVCGILLFAITVVIFAPAMLSPTWLWTWAILLSASLVAGRHVFQQPSWYAISTIPVGVVATCTAQIWLGGQTWQTSALWTRFINGEAMAASLLMCLIGGSLWWALSAQNPAKKWLRYSNMGWFSATLLIAAVLSLTPDTRMGIVPAWVVTATLFAAAFTSLLMSLRDYRVCYLTPIATGLAFNSIYKVSPSLGLDHLPDAIYWTLSVAGLLTLFSEFSCRLTKLTSKDCLEAALVVRKTLATIGLATIGVATFLVVISGQAHFQLCCATHVISVLTMSWIALLLSNLNIFKIAQLPSLLLTLSLTFRYFETELWSKAGWLSGNAMWGWAAALGTLAVLWYLAREVIALCVSRMAGPSAPSDGPSDANFPVSLRDRLVCLFGRPTPPLGMPDSWFGLAATSIAAIATTYLLACLNRSTISQVPFDYNSSWLMPTLSWFSLGAFIGLVMRQKQQKEFTSTFAGLFFIFAILWFSCQVTVSSLSDAKTMLIVAVSLSTTLIFLANVILRYLGRSLLTPHLVNVCHATQCLVLFTGSISLLYSGVIVPHYNGQLADLTSAGIISIWWFIVSFLALWQARRSGQTWALALSAIFFAAAGTVLATPLVFQSVPTQIQMACLLTFGWVALASRVIGETTDSADKLHDRQYFRNILKLMVASGVITAVLTTAVILFQLRHFYDHLSPTGCTLALIAIATLASGHIQRFFCGNSSPRLTGYIAFALSLLAGQVAWILHQLNMTNGLLGGIQSIEIISGIWILAASVSILIPRRHQRAIDFYHMAAATFTTLLLASIYRGNSDVLPWLSLIATVNSGAQITLMALGIKKLEVPAIATRLLGWQVGLAGMVLPYLFNDFSLSYTILWISTWVLVWRYLGRDRANTAGKLTLMNQLPLLDFSIIIFAASFADLTHSLGFIDNAHSLLNPFLWLRLTCYCLLAASIVLRPRSIAQWFTSLTMLCTAFSILAITITGMLDGSTSHRYTAAIISYAFLLVVITSSLGNLAKLTGWLTSSVSVMHFKRLASTTTWMLTIFTCVSVASPILMMIGRLPLIEVQIAIVSIAMTAWAFTEIAEQASVSKLRYVAVSLGLVAIAMWATASKLDNEYLLLNGCMRWLVASTLIIPTLLFALPQLISEGMRKRWMDAFQKGAITTVVAALGATFAMLILEFLLRDSNGIANLSLVAVVGAALTLGALSLMGGMTALATGPNGYLRSTIPISDQQRTYLILATQAFGFLTWLHVFLCKPNWAFAGLREHWPYVVMALSFLSVGLTEFSRRRGDAVMAATIRKTSLYLPLIPMLGLWLSATNQGDTILANMINSHYEILLIIAAAYYFAVGTMWKAPLPRVSGVILGNAAWWFVLMQLPGWGFLIHPQLWLIPPAACILIMTHLYRERIDPSVASGIRYGATLVIYISSSADMLLQQIGTTLSGPIILILLALAGMLLGVILRIRPFLYLGATFVFLGVTSMVWHANQAFESTWPWWVFGISMGLILLAGLMMLEKFKPQLQAHAKKLSTWDA